MHNIDRPSSVAPSGVKSSGRIIDLGFDLAGRKEPRLKRGAIFSWIGALAEIGPLVIAYVCLQKVQAATLDTTTIIYATAGLLASVVLSILFKMWGMIDNFCGTYALVCESRVRLADHLRRLPMGFWNRRKSGEIGSILTDEFAMYSEVATHVWSLLVSTLAKPLGVCLFIVYLDWRLGLLAFCGCISGFAAIPWSHRILNRASDRLHGVKTRTYDQLIEYVHGIETLHKFDQSSSFHERLEQSLEKLEAEQMRMELAPAPLVLSFKLIVWTFFCLMLALGTQWVGDGSLSPFNLLFVLFLAIHVFEGTSDFSVFLSLARFAGRSLERIRGLFETPVQDAGRVHDEGDESFEAGRIELSKVSFAYEGRPALREVCASFDPGTVTALVGHSGSGKSTLAQLINRLWDVDLGTLSISGRKIQEIPLDTLRANVAMVLQDVVLFEETVADNIRLGKPNATLEQVKACARAARAHAFIEALDDGYDTVLAQAGAELSGGQRQRIAIARALLHDAPILVLDEATSAVDPENESLIQEALANLMKGRTVIVIAHRLWTVQQVDKILYLEHGEIAERGTHEHLIALEGGYYKMWTQQRLEQPQNGIS